MPESTISKPKQKEKINCTKKHKRNQHHQASYAQTIAVYFLFFLFLTAFSCVFLVHFLRRFELAKEEPKLFIPPPPPPPPPAPEIIQISHPLRVKSQAIWNAVGKNTEKLEELLKNAEPAALHNYECERDDDNKIHLYNRILEINCLDSFKTLLNAKIFDINHHNLLHKTILHFSYKQDPIQKKFYEVLLQHGADIEYINSDGLTPLASAVKYKNYLALSFLIDNKAILNRSLPEYDSILHYFTDKMVESPLPLSKETKKILQKLLKSGANPFHRGLDGCTAFHHAILIMTNMDVIQTFITTSPPWNFFFSFYYRPTLLNYPIIPTEITTSTDLNLYSYTPLHLAVHLRSPNLIRYLLDMGASNKIKDNAKLTAFEHAKIKKDPIIIKAFNSRTWIEWISFIFA